MMGVAVIPQSLIELQLRRPGHREVQCAQF